MRRPSPSPISIKVNVVTASKHTDRCVCVHVAAPQLIAGKDWCERGERQEVGETEGGGRERGGREGRGLRDSLPCP